MGDEATTRKLAVLLGISYQRDPKSGDIVHTNKIFLLNSEGEVVETVEGLNGNVEPIIEKLEK